MHPFPPRAGFCPERPAFAARHAHTFTPIAVLAAGVLLLAAPSTRAQPYSATDIGVVQAGSTSYPSGINSSGEVTGFAVNSQDQNIGFSYSGGAYTNLDTLADSDEADPAGINDSGVVVGSAFGPGDSTIFGFVLSNGTITNIGTLGGPNSWASAINAAGTVVGASLTSEGKQVPISYSGGVLTNLGTGSGVDGYALGINNAGTIVGYLQSGSLSGPFQAFSYTNGTFTNLGTLGGTDSVANAINSSGAVVGWSDTTGQASTVAFVCSNGTMTSLGTLGGIHSVANGINDNGLIVGQSSTAASGSGLIRAFLYANGSMLDLNTLVTGMPSGVVLTGAYAINGSGQIVASGSDGHTYVLSPTTYTAVNLGTLGGSNAVPFGLNLAGTVVGSADQANTNGEAFTYGNGALTGLGTLGGPTSTATAINSTGMIVGYSDLAPANEDGQEVTGFGAFYYTAADGLTALTMPDGYNSEALAVNAAGTIVGYSQYGLGYGSAFSYSDGVMTDLGGLGGPGSQANGINSSGTIVGQATDGANRTLGFVYSNGAMASLGTLPGGNYSEASAINDAGVIVGSANTTTNTAAVQAFSYSNGVMTGLGTLSGDTYAVANAINGSGVIVGTSGPSGGTPRAFIYSGGLMFDLRTLVTGQPSTLRLLGATGINDAGQIVVSGRNGSNVTNAYLLSPVGVSPTPTPTPTPTTTPTPSPTPTASPTPSPTPSATPSPTPTATPTPTSTSGGGYYVPSPTPTPTPTPTPAPIHVGARPTTTTSLTVSTPSIVTANKAFTATVSVFPAGSADTAGSVIAIAAAGNGDIAPASATLVNGVATFTATFAATGYLMVNDGVHSAQAVVRVEPAQAVDLTAPATVAAGIPFTVEATTNDVLNGASFTIQDSDAAGALPSTGSFVGNAASFTATLNTPGIQTITITDGAATASIQITVVAPAQTLTVTAPAAANAGSSVNVTVHAEPAGYGLSDPLSIQLFDPAGAAPATAALANGTATIPVTFGTAGLELVYVSDTLNHKALGYALVQVAANESSSTGSQYDLAVTYPTFITLGAPFTVTLGSSAAGAGAGDAVTATFPAIDPADAAGAPVVSGSLAANGVFTGVGEYPATAAAVAAVGSHPFAVPGSLQATGVNAVSPVSAPVVVVPPAASLAIQFLPPLNSSKNPIVYSPATSLTALTFGYDQGGKQVLQGSSYPFTIVGGSAGNGSTGVGPDPIVISSSDPAAVLPATATLTQGVNQVGSTNKSVTLQEDGITNGFVTFNTPGQQTIEVVDQANTNATCELSVLVVAYASPSIATQPQDQTAAVGATASFWLAATGVINLKYQWYFNGQPIPGGTTPILFVNSVSTASAGTYTVTVTDGVESVTSQPATLSLTSAGGVPPAVAQPPASTTVGTMGTAVFTVSTGGSGSAISGSDRNPPLATRVAGATRYQWFMNGSAIPGATSPSLGLGSLTPGYAGDYVCLVSNAAGSVLTEPATLHVVAAPSSRLTNFSCRAEVESGSGVAIVGFVVSGQTGVGTRNFLLRASGPALSSFGLTGTLPDPRLQLSDVYGAYDSNDGWQGSPLVAAASSSLGAFAWPSGASHDAALFETLAPGAYTAEISGSSGDSGLALAEVYDAAPEYSGLGQVMNLSNLSMRAQVGTGSNIVIAGFTISGATSKTVLIRASGPALIPFGVTGVLADPVLRVLSGSSVLAANTGWAGDPLIAAAAASVGAFSWGPSGTPDSAVLVTLPPGDYTAEVSGASGDTGVALVEIYALP